MINELALKVAGTPIPAPSSIPTGGFFLTGNKVISLGIQVAFVFGILLSLVYVIWGGIDWTMSGGNKEAMQKARSKLIFAVIGLCVILLAFLVVNWLGFALDAKFFTPIN